MADDVSNLKLISCLKEDLIVKKIFEETVEVRSKTLAHTSHCECIRGPGFRSKLFLKKNYLEGLIKKRETIVSMLCLSNESRRHFELGGMIYFEVPRR